MTWDTETSVRSDGARRRLEAGATGDPEREIPAPPRPELYNIADDPGEQNECSADHPEVVDRLSRQLDAWFEDVEADRTSITDEWKLNPESGW